MNVGMLRAATTWLPARTPVFVEVQTPDGVVRLRLLPMHSIETEPVDSKGDVKEWPCALVLKADQKERVE